jgi:predicted P-loop ATPase/GTPase
LSVDIHWVVGQGTNVGKTTVAAALVRTLSALGLRVVPFKPYSGGKFIEVVDLMFERRDMTTARLFGGDGAKLIDASPLLSPDDADLVQPISLFYYPEFEQPILARVGARMAGGARFFKTPAGLALEAREDYRRLLRLIGVDDSLSFETRDLRFAATPQLGQREVDACFEHLLGKYDATTVVCEGASAWLPYWRKGLVINHVTYVQRNELFFYERADVVLPAEPQPSLVAVAQLFESLGEKRCRRVPLPFSLSRWRSEVADAAVRNMLGPGFRLS